MDGSNSDTTAEYGMVESCAAKYSYKREGQPDNSAGSRSLQRGEYVAGKSDVDEYMSSGHCCIL